MKACKRCKTEKSEKEFCKCSRNKDGLKDWCRRCVSEQGKEYRSNPDVKKRICEQQKIYVADGRRRPYLKMWESKNKEKCVGYRKKYHKNHPEARKATFFRAKYGITLDEYRGMIKNQENKCAICGNVFTGIRPLTPNVDHEHRSKTVRGILCIHCNVGIGVLKEDINILNNAIKYLEKWR